MSYEPFYDRFPEIAEKETRTIQIFSGERVPAGNYGLVEMYCNDEGCDFQRVFLDVYDWERQQSMAVITYGWESEAFCRRWFGSSDPKWIEMSLPELKGPALNSASPQSKSAPSFLKLVTEFVLNDPDYVNRLKRHYKLFKESVDRKVKSKTQHQANTLPALPASKSKKRRRRS